MCGLLTRGAAGYAQLGAAAKTALYERYQEQAESETHRLTLTRTRTRTRTLTLALALALTLTLDLALALALSATRRRASWSGCWTSLRSATTWRSW